MEGSLAIASAMHRCVNWEITESALGSAAEGALGNRGALRVLPRVLRELGVPPQVLPSVEIATRAKRAQCGGIKTERAPSALAETAPIPLSTLRSPPPEHSNFPEHLREHFLEHFQRYFFS